MLDYVFADESGTTGNARCYAIGALTIPATSIDAFNHVYSSMVSQYHISEELKWNRIRTTYSTMNFVLDWLYRIVRSKSLSFDVIVVNKQLYHNWRGDSANKERAFYVTYTQLLRHRARQSEDTCQVFIDDRSDAYAKQDEVLGIITNHMLAQIQASARLSTIAKTDSRLQPAIQLADVLTGAINAAHRLYLEPTFELQQGKTLLIHRMARILGWDTLHYDTWPNPKFNIWHFPIQYRAKPRTVNVSIASSVPYITASDLKEETS